MSKTLVIAEKPSVAQDIVRALTPEAGKFDKHDDHFENEQLRRHLGRRPPARDQGAGGVRRQARQVELRPPAGDPAALRPEADRQDQDAPERGRQAGQAQGRDRADQRLRRRPRGRADLPPDRAVRRRQEPLGKPVQRLWLQSDDAAGDPRRLRRSCAATSRCCGLADAARCRSEADWLVGINGTRAMTAFNSRDGGFFLTTVGRVQTPTLSIVVEREEKIRKHVRARLLGGARRPSRAEAGEYEGKWFDPKWKKNPTTTPSSAPTASGTRPTRRPSPRRCAASRRRVTEESQAQHAGRAAAVRPDLAAARGQRPLRLLGQDHAVARAGALREAQGADLPADRLARPARGLPAGRQADHGDARQRAACQARCAPLRARSRRSKADYVKPIEAHLRQRQGLATTSRSSRRCRRRRACRSSRHKLYDLVVKRFLAVFFPPRRVHGHHAHHAPSARPARSTVPDQRQGAGQAGLARHLRQGGAGDDRRQPGARSRPASWCAPRASTSRR